MAFLCETPDRRVIPNWRSLRDTVSNGELEYPSNEHIAFNLEEYEHDWSREHSLLYASELVSAAVANGIRHNSVAKDAAEFVLNQDGKTTESQRTVALSLLAEDNDRAFPKYNHEIDELLLNSATL